MNTKTEYWIQQLRGFGDWFDYCQKKDIKELKQRLLELNDKKEVPEFRGISRVVCDSILD